MYNYLIKYFAGELDTDTTTRLFSAIQADEVLKAEFIRLQNLHALSQLSELSKDEVEGQEGYRLFLSKKKIKQQQQFIRNLFKYAAIAVLLIGSTFFFTKYVFENDYHNQKNNTLYVPAGQRAKLTLQDGSVVWLNANSTLKYPSRFSGKTRSVEIIGEGYFDIAKNKKKPFIVTTQQIEMIVLGTEFNVYSYPETGYIQTDLIEGSLMVYNSENKNKSVTLSPRQQVTISEKEMIVGHSEPSDYYLWKEGVYAFDNQRLITIIEKLQLYYDVKIVVEDPEIFNVRYTGKFRQRDGVADILKVIQKIHPFKILMDKEENLITLIK